MGDNSSVSVVHCEMITVFQPVRAGFCKLCRLQDLMSSKQGAHILSLSWA